MKLMVLGWLLVLSCGLSANRSCFQDFDRSLYYSVMAAGKINEIDAELIALATTGILEKDAYEGALLMRKSGIVSTPAQKLKLFKTGRMKLETALGRDSTNGEYHFLRLIIQEHSPDIVKYRGNLQTDKGCIIRSFSNLSPEVKQAIINYSKSSTIVHPQDL